MSTVTDRVDHGVTGMPVLDAEDVIPIMIAAAFLCPDTIVMGQ